MNKGMAGRRGNPRFDEQNVLKAPAQGRGDFATFLPVTNGTTGKAFTQVECSCGLRHVHTVQFNNFECSSCGRKYIWGNERTGQETFPRS